MYLFILSAVTTGFPWSNDSNREQQAQRVFIVWEEDSDGTREWGRLSERRKGSLKLLPRREVEWTFVIKRSVFEMHFYNQLYVYMFRWYHYFYFITCHYSQVAWHVFQSPPSFYKYFCYRASLYLCSALKLTINGTAPSYVDSLSLVYLRLCSRSYLRISRPFCWVSY